MRSTRLAKRFGTCFPLAAQRLRQDGRIMAEAHGDRKNGISRILLAEEDHEIRALWRTVLDRAGYDVIACGSQEALGQAIAAISTGAMRLEVDLFVCDARMLTDDVKETVSRLQKKSQFPNDHFP